jgi:hypothetical protein
MAVHATLAGGKRVWMVWYWRPAWRRTATPTTTRRGRAAHLKTRDALIAAVCIVGALICALAMLAFATTPCDALPATFSSGP